MSKWWEEFQKRWEENGTSMADYDAALLGCQDARQQAPAEQEPAFWIDPLELHWIAEPLASLNCYPKPLDGLMPVYLSAQAAPQNAQMAAIELTRQVHKALGLSDSYLNIIDTGSGFVKFKYDDTQRAFKVILDALVKRQAAPQPEQSELIPAPFNPTEEQWGGIARDIMMWLDFGRPTVGKLYEHFDNLGIEPPQWLLEETEMDPAYPDNVPSKGTRCTIIYKAMLAALAKHGEASQ